MLDVLVLSPAPSPSLCLAKITLLRRLQWQDSQSFHARLVDGISAGCWVCRSLCFLLIRTPSSRGSLLIEESSDGVDTMASINTSGQQTQRLSTWTLNRSGETI